MEIGASKEKAHSALIRSLDFAHNDSQLLASCGNDCRVKIWDMRYRCLKKETLSLGEISPDTEIVSERIACETL